MSPLFKGYFMRLEWDFSFLDINSPWILIMFTLLQHYYLFHSFFNFD